MWMWIASVIAAILCGEAESAIDGYYFTADEVAAFKYAPIVSCDVERSFSKYRAFLSDNKLSFSFENIRKHMMIACNKD